MVIRNLYPTPVIHHHSQHRPGHKEPDSPAELRGGRGAGTPAGGGAAGGQDGAEVQRNTSAPYPERAPGGGGPLGAVLLTTREKPEDKLDGDMEQERKAPKSD